MFHVFHVKLQQFCFNHENNARFNLECYVMSVLECEYNNAPSLSSLFIDWQYTVCVIILAQSYRGNKFPVSPVYASPWFFLQSLSYNSYHSRLRARGKSLHI